MKANKDDLVYVALMLLSIAFGKVVRSRYLLFEHPPWVRKTLSSTVGLLIGLTVSGLHIWHPICSTALQAALLKILPTAHLHWVSFLCGFAHLTLFRLCGQGDGWPWSGFSPPPAHTNAIQMILTLKMVGLSLEVKEARLLHRGEKDTASPHPSPAPPTATDKLIINPSVADVFHYAFTHAGFIAGPYFKFRTFQDMYLSPWSFKADCEGVLLRRIAPVAVYVVLFLVVGRIFPADYIKEDSFFTDTSLLYRLFYMNPIFFTFRMRMFSAFILSECSCIMAGLGAYPNASKPTPGNGPTETPEKMAKLSQLVLSRSKEADTMVIDFKTVYNLDVYAVETVPTMGQAIKEWNMTVQYWLVVNVYKQLPRSSAYCPKPLRAFVVMLVSALWHGLHSGYYLCLGSVPIFLAVEDLYQRLLKSFITGSPSSLMSRATRDSLVSAYDSLAWFVRFQWFCYVGMAFLLLRADTTLRYWASVHYSGHLSAVAFYVVAIFVAKPIIKRFQQQS